MSILFRIMYKLQLNLLHSLAENSLPKNRRK